ncbi:MAG: SMC-Scp complex subunit ScpB [Ignavibacteria bacterium]|nr:SMC-Scp complex subunit ScpB [Ignavibacteria bacterium]
MSSAGIKNIIEALIFASDEEISTKEIKEILDGFKIDVTAKEIEGAIEELNTDYENNANAFEIIKIAGGYIYATKKKYAHFLGKLAAETQKKKLSQSAIETLAIIAYKQPITRSEIEFIRGVNVDYIVNSLLERDLISIKGRADGPGRPILYGTTASFLRVLGLSSLSDLPKLKEINEILRNEKIEGITDADIDLFNTMSIQAQAELQAEKKEEQLSLLDKEPGSGNGADVGNSAHSVTDESEYTEINEEDTDEEHGEDNSGTNLNNEDDEDDAEHQS